MQTTRLVGGSATQTWWKAGALVALWTAPSLVSCAHEYPAEDPKGPEESDFDPVLRPDPRPNDAGTKDAGPKDAGLPDAGRECTMPSGKTECFYCIASFCCAENLDYFEKAEPLASCINKCTASNIKTCGQACLDRFPTSIPYLTSYNDCLDTYCTEDCSAAE